MASEASAREGLLEADGIVRRFGGLVAVDVDHLTVEQGTITALIGPNGAGKTTLFNVLTGFDRPDAGTWSLAGRPIAGLAAHRIARLGMVRTFQLTKALARLTVLENMCLAATGQRGESFFGALVPRLWRDQEAAIEARATALLDRFRLSHMAGELAGTLSGGQRKLLEMARALMVEPSLVVLDEPTAGVNPALTQSLLQDILRLKQDGVTVLFVEHDMDVVREISDHVICLAEGRIIAEGSPAGIAANPAVIDAYLGHQHGARAGEA